MLNAILKRSSNARGWILGFFLCAAAESVLGQQPGMQLPHPQLPEENTHNTKTTHHHTATKDVSDKLRKALNDKNPAYAGSNIQAEVDDQSITLTGMVTSQAQREMALQLAQAYADDRKVVDRMVIQQ